MARSTSTPTSPTAFDSPGKVLHQNPMHDELETSFLEYSVSSLSRALPDARDGLKPVHRRILFAMSEANLRPDRPHVKSARVVGDVMGKYHPHGDSAIYDTMVGLAQDHNMSLPLIDGKGNWGSPNDSAAASRYTECRLTASAMSLTGEIDEDTVLMLPNYDGKETEPATLPASYPNLLVNGGQGIAVGYASKLIPHNLGEVIAATRHLLAHPDADLDALMRHLPGPDLPTGGQLLGLDMVRQAYETGAGVVRLRGRGTVGTLEGSRGRQAITITELPYGTGTEAIIEAIKKEQAKFPGIADVKDLSEGENTELVVELKSGFNGQAVLADMYRHTPLEVSFGIRNCVMLDGRPQTLGLKPLLEVWISHRVDVVTRRTRYRLRKAQDRAHLIEGLLIALDNIEAVVKVIRGADTTEQARQALVTRFSMSEIQAGYVLDMQLRRLVALEVDKLRTEHRDLLTAIAGYEAILNSETVLRAVIDDELVNIDNDLAGPRRTALVDGDLKELVAAAAASPLEVKDDPCQVLLSATGLLARTAADSEEAAEVRKRSGRVKHDAIVSIAHVTARGRVLLLTNRGRATKVDVLGLPPLPEQAGTVSLRGGAPSSEFVHLEPGERVIAVASLADDAVPLALATRDGVVMRVRPEWPLRSDTFDLISLKGDDQVVAAAPCPDNREVVFLTSDAQLLRFPAENVRPQGPGSGGMAGIKLGAGQRVVAFNAVRLDDAEHGEPLVVTSAGPAVKVTPLAEYPVKGRATSGVRCMRFLRNAECLVVAYVGTRPAACTDRGEPVDLPEVDRRRDGSGSPTFGPDLIGHLIERG